MVYSFVCLPGKEGNRIIEHDDSREGKRILVATRGFSSSLSLSLRVYSFFPLNSDRIFLTSGSCRDETMRIPLCTRASDNVHRCGERAFPRKAYRGRKETHFSSDRTAGFSFNLRTSHWRFPVPPNPPPREDRRLTARDSFHLFPRVMKLFLFFFSLRIHREYGNGARRSDAYVGIPDSTREIKATRRDATRRKLSGKPDGGNTRSIAPLRRDSDASAGCSCEKTQGEGQRERKKERSGKGSKGAANVAALRQNPLAGLER